MNYSNEFQNVILKQQMILNKTTRQVLEECIKNSNSKENLEMLLRSNNIDKHIDKNNELLKQYIDDPEMIELIKSDSEGERHLKRVTENRLNELEKQDHTRKQEDEEENDNCSSKEHDETQQSSLENEEILGEENQIQMSNHDFNNPILNMKYDTRESIYYMESIKGILDETDSIFITIHMSDKKNFFAKVKQTYTNLKKYPWCDFELQTLSDRAIELSQDIIDKTEELEEEVKRKLQEAKEEDRVVEDVEREERQNTGNEEDDERKSWELSPEEKRNIQEKSGEIAKEHMERQDNPEPKIETTTMENSDDLSR